ncbi:MAG: DUF192 domain-containing protein, partial [Candidatus Acetothermia bacterium]
HVSSLGFLDGMVFLFPEPVRSGFWMRDTEIALQIGFFSEAGRLVESVVMEPCWSDDCPVHVPEEPFRFVLELPTDSYFQLEEMHRSLLEIPGDLT